MIPEFWNATVVAKSKYFDGKAFIYLVCRLYIKWVRNEDDRYQDYFL